MSGIKLAWAQWSWVGAIVPAFRIVTEVGIPATS